MIQLRIFLYIQIKNAAACIFCPHTNIFIAVTTKLRTQKWQCIKKICILQMHLIQDAEFENPETARNHILRMSLIISLEYL